MIISFDNTEIAFEYKTDQDLRRARLLFSSMGISWLVKLGTRLTPWIIKAKLPVNNLIRNTIYKQFVGGETLEETRSVTNALDRYKVQAILDYGVEGKEGEENFELATKEFIKVIEYASTQHNIPLISVKLTGFSRFGFLKKLDEAAEDKKVISALDLEALEAADKQEYERVRNRLKKICAAAAKYNIGVLIDAEETWIQHPVDVLTTQMMQLYNKGKAVVYNTIQLYRHDRLQFLKDSHDLAISEGFVLGVKLVRGAYMEKERKRAEELQYPSPVQPDKAATDRDYNSALEFCVSHLNTVYMIVASHNEYSNLYTTQLLQKHYGSPNHRQVHFSQLYGMSDNITFNLAKAGCSVSKYLPFGPIEDVIPYLMRRAEENSSVSGQTGRELGLIRNELKRRRNK